MVVFFVFKFVVLLLVVKEGEYIYLCLHLGWKLKFLNIINLRSLFSNISILELSICLCTLL